MGLSPGIDKMKINKNKRIGKVLFIVEGARTELYILRKIFTEIFDYQLEALTRNKPYKKYNIKKNPHSECFTLSNFYEPDYDKWFAKGKDLKQYTNKCKINHQNIDGKSLCKAANEMLNVLKELDVKKINLDEFYESNIKVFESQEKYYREKKLYRALSLLCIALMDLKLIEFDE